MSNAANAALAEPWKDLWNGDLTLTDKTVSWRHAELQWTAGVWMLADLGSTNGTHVNGWRAGPGFAIRPGDRVRFGTLTFVVTE